MSKDMLVIQFHLSHSALQLTHYFFLNSSWVVLAQVFRKACI